MFLIAWLLLGLWPLAECMIMRVVTGYALIEIGRDLLAFEATLLILSTRSMVVAVGATLILMLVRISQKFELVEDKIRYCAIHQSRPIQTNS